MGLGLGIALLMVAWAQGSLRLSIPEEAPEEPDVAGAARAYWRCREGAPPSAPPPPACPREFDGRGCWAATPAGATTAAGAPCPGRRECGASGEWLDADYANCSGRAPGGPLLRLLLEELQALDASPYEEPSTARAFEDCLDAVLSAPLTPGFSGCPRTFDGWGCWPDTAPGRLASLPCPGFVPGFAADRRAHRACGADGRWFRHPATGRAWSNYTTCVDREDLRFRQRIVRLYIAGYATSVVALLAALVLFLYLRSEPCPRISIHKHLFASFVVNNLMWILWYTQVVEHPQVILDNGVGCQLLHVLVHYFLVSNYLWMFCEGLYLHTLLVVAFVAEGRLLRWFYLIGWGTPLPIIAAYAGLRMASPDSSTWCWIEESPYSWIISGPVCFSMLLNLVFLVNIVRVLVTKLRAVHSPDTHHTRKAVRATLILIPLLGLHYVLTPFRPEPSAPGEAVYETLSALVTSFQGLCVACLFCFFNGEVLGLIRKRWQQALLSRRRLSYAATNLSKAELENSL